MEKVNSNLTLPAVRSELGDYRPNKIWWRRWARRAAVTGILRNAEVEGGNQVEILLIKRTERDGDPWSGHMSFPGGRMEPDDRNVYQTALRELEEEIGLQIERRGEYLGRLSDLPARPWRLLRRPLVVSSFFFQLQQFPDDWQIDPHEVSELVWIPLNFLADPENRDTMTWSRKGISMTLPCYWYEGHRIWGMTLRMLDELILVVTEGK